MTPELATTWLSRCLLPNTSASGTCNSLGGRSGCEVWECETEDGPVVLKVYSPGFDDYSGLGPVDTMRKHAFALRELPLLGVPTPRNLGLAVQGEEAALVMERVEMEDFTPSTRVDAARVLARLHSLQPSHLSDDLAELVTRSTPNRGRIGEATAEPPLREVTLQHGDYYSVNLAASSEGVRVLDWDLLALGDPMWDLGHLVAADRGVPEEEVEAVLAAYAQIRPFDHSRLDWQRRCWEEFWARR